MTGLYPAEPGDRFEFRDVYEYPGFEADLPEDMDGFAPTHLVKHSQGRKWRIWARTKGEDDGG